MKNEFRFGLTHSTQNRKSSMFHVISGTIRKIRHTPADNEKSNFSFVSLQSIITIKNSVKKIQNKRKTLFNHKINLLFIANKKEKKFN